MTFSDTNRLWYKAYGQFCRIYKVNIRDCGTTIATPAGEFGQTKLVANPP